MDLLEARIKLYEIIANNSEHLTDNGRYYKPSGVFAIVDEQIEKIKPSEYEILTETRLRFISETAVRIFIQCQSEFVYRNGTHIPAHIYAVQIAQEMCDMVYPIPAKEI